MTWLNEGLIGVEGGRALIQTPALVIDLDVLERNIAHMAAHAKAKGIGLRPHAKSHKCLEIAKRQIAAGAVGICVAKLGEAEVLGASGEIESILITSPVVTDAGIARLVSLNEKVKSLIAVCDDAEIAAQLNEAARATGKPLKILIDIDPGMGRTGIRPGDDAAALVGQIAQSNGLEYAGLQCYAGHVQHMESPNERRAQSLAALDELAKFRDTLSTRGLNPNIISGGGTGTFDIDPDARVLNELQVGSYIFMDRQYNDVWTKPGDTPPFETSLFVQTTIISAHRDGLATTDAGLKSFATDAATPQIARGAPEGASYFFYGDEQGGVIYAPGGRQLRPKDVIFCVVPHCDPTVNLYDCYHVMRGETLEFIWSIEARGRAA